MAIKRLKKELVKLISETDDEALLSMVKEDISFYKTSKPADIIDNLSKNQLKELESLANEPDAKDTLSFGEFKRATKKWRTK